MRLTTGITSLDILCGTLAFLLIFRLITRARRIPKGLRLPPGPPGMPIIGNVRDLSKGSPVWVIFEQWAKEYGDVFHIKLLGQTMIFVNSLEIAHDLFETRSANYSDRVDFPMLVDLMGWDWNIALMKYGNWWRRHRRIFHQHFNADASATYNDIQTRQTRTLLRRFHDSPADFISHIRHHAGAIIMEIVYGIRVKPKDDPYIEIAEAAVIAGAQAAIPGKFLVDTFPFLKYVPEWIPGASFQRKAREGKMPAIEMAYKPLKAVKDALEVGTARPSVVTTLLEDLSQRTDAPEDEEIVIKNVAAVAYAGGADTTVSALSTFMLAMVLYPEVQRKAQTELDAVVGNRLPEFEDRDSLPYVTAICKEIHRWHPAFPLGLGHRVMEDDIYGEYFIPAGSVVIAPAWTILRDEKIYGPNTDTFSPERFFRPGVIDPIGHFGFGRRICPGRYMADNSIFIAVASILKVFNISPAVDHNGVESPTGPHYSTGFLTHPEPFDCTIKPRSASAEAFLAPEYE